MNRRHFVALLATPAVLQLLQACGSSDAGSNGTTVATTPTTSPASNGAPPTTGGTGQAAGATLIKSTAARVTTDDPDTGAAAAVAALDAFAADLYGRLVTPDDNVAFSPASILIALAMASAGARGTTLTELDAALHITDPAGIHRSVNALAAALASRNEGGDAGDGATLDITNSLWAQRGTTFDPTFLDLLAAEYGAGVETVDYRTAPDAAREAINAWVDEATHHRIAQLLGQGAITPDSRLTLVDAVYLAASWRTPFEASATAAAPFTTGGGKVVSAEMMHTTDRFAYAAGDSWRAIDLPYLTPGLSMTVILTDGDAGAEGESGADRAGVLPDLSTVTAAMSPTKVRLALPKFDFDTRTSLATTLRQMGVHAAFDDHSADFTGMTADEPLYISDVVHEANITVDEHGTEAAAATAVVMTAGAAPGVAEEPVELTFDRPFTFVIRDAPTGAVLFLGRVTDPTR